MPYLQGQKRCARTGCGKLYTPKKLGGSDEDRKGWLIQLNGVVWCPEHAAKTNKKK